MTAIDHSIPMSGRQPNVLNALSQGTQVAAQTAAVQRQAQGQNLFRQHGAGIMAGDHAAMNALAQFDPQTALQARQAQQALRVSEAQLAQIRQQTAQSAQAHVAKINAAEAATEAEKIQAGLTQVLPMVMSAKETGDVSQLNQALHGLGLKPVRDVNEALVQVAQYEGVYDVLSRVQEMQTGPEARAPGNDYERYALREREAGREPMGEFEYRQAVTATKGGEQFSVKTPDGTSVTYGQGNTRPVERLSVSSPGSMIDTIDGILGDPALDNATGMLSFTQAIPGTPMYRVGTRMKQLEGQAFLQAFEMLKGAGQITEIEGSKATQAVGRLDSAQHPRDYRDALTELRSILIGAMERPRGWADTTAGRISTMSAGEIAELPLEALKTDERDAARKRLKAIREADNG